MNLQARSVGELLSGAQAVLFDFDGPLCDVFAGLPARDVARKLAATAGQRLDTDDPLEVLRQSARSGMDTLRSIEDSLISAEVEAVKVSAPTDGGVESMRACLEVGLKVGIVSNNSRDAILVFLGKVGLISAVSPVVGRAYAEPDRMKPNPWPLQCALDELRRSPGEAIFVGDSLTDIHAAHAIGMPCLAYANKSGKQAIFASAGATVFDSMWKISEAVRR